MHGRPPDDSDAKAAQKREQDAERQRDKRKRDRKNVVPFPGRAPKEFLDAMVARAVFFGVSEQEAERDANDPKKISELAFRALRFFAEHWRDK